VRRLVIGLGLLPLVSATPACLLYTDRINGPPTVAIERVGELHPGVHVVFKARASDPDGDPLTFVWSRINKPCPGSADDWAGAQVSTGDSLDILFRVTSEWSINGDPTVSLCHQITIVGGESGAGQTKADRGKN